jgi:hypothetical protein
MHACMPSDRKSGDEEKQPKGDVDGHRTGVGVPSSSKARRSRGRSDKSCSANRISMTKLILWDEKNHMHTVHAIARDGRPSTVFALADGCSSAV